MIQVTFAPRLKRIADLMEGRQLEGLQQKLHRITTMTTERLLHDSQFIRGAAQSEALWVTRVSADQRLIFRRTGPDSIEVIDVVSHEDLNKFVKLQS